MKNYGHIKLSWIPPSGKETHVTQVPVAYDRYDGESHVDLDRAVEEAKAYLKRGMAHDYIYKASEENK